MDKFTIRAGCG